MSRLGEEERGAEAGTQRLGRLIAARLAVTVAVLLAALAMSAAELFPEEEQGLFATIVAGFVLTIASAAAIRGRFAAGWGWVQIALDMAIVTSLVRFSGGGESIFVFLYVPVAVYAALIYGRIPGYAAAVGAALLYGGLLVSGAGHPGTPPPEALRVAMWGGQSSGLLLVVMLANALMGERDRTRRALRERTRDLRSLQRLHARTVESLNSGLATLDRDGRVTSMNPEAERITGVAAHSAAGVPFDEVLPGALAALEAIGWEGAGERSQLEFRDPAGATHFIGLSSSTLRSADGADDGRVVIFQDVTRIVEMEQALRRGERMAAIGELSARLAHEIRNPLAAISGSIEMLEQVEGDASDAARLRGIVARETERLDLLITDFLRYARPAPPDRVRVELAPVVEEIGAMLEAARSGGGTEFRVERHVPAGLALWADEGQLRQVLWNLWRNAEEAMPAGGEISIEARALPPQAAARGGRRGNEPEGSVEIVIADRGVGIPEDHLERVFEPFFTTKKEGTGLGLATVHRIVESNDGEIAVESRPGEGTRFRLRFAAARATGERP